MLSQKILIGLIFLQSFFGPISLGKNQSRLQSMMLLKVSENYEAGKRPSRLPGERPVRSHEETSTPPQPGESPASSWMP